MRNDAFSKQTDQFVIGDITLGSDVPGVLYLRRKRPGVIRGIVRNTGSAVFTAVVQNSADNVTFANYTAGRFAGTAQASVVVQPGGSAEFEWLYAAGDAVRSYLRVTVSPLPGAVGIVTVFTEDGAYAVLKGIGADSNLSLTD